MRNCIFSLSVVVLFAAPLWADMITDWKPNEAAVYSGSNLSVGWSASIGGDAVAGGALQLGGSATVEGNLFARSSITTGWDSSFGATYGEVGASLFDDWTFPPLDMKPNGGQALSALSDSTLSLSPGTYGDISAQWRGNLELTAGRYYFDSLTLGDEAKILLDASAGDVLVYVAGDTSLAWKNSITRYGSGGSLFSIGGNLNVGTENFVDSSLLVGGPATVGWDSQVTGQLFAYGDVAIGDQAVINGDQLLAIPEPGTVLLVLIGVAVLARRRSGHKLLRA